MTANGTDVQASSRRGRGGSQPTARSHEDIYDLVERCRAESARANRKADDSEIQRSLMVAALQRVETKLDGIVSVVGSAGSDEHGKLIGTGLAGSLARLTDRVDKRFQVYDRWRYLALGGCCTIGPLAAAIWWLVSRRLDALLRPH